MTSVHSRYAGDHGRTRRVGGSPSRGGVDSGLWRWSGTSFRGEAALKPSAEFKVPSKTLTA